MNGVLRSRPVIASLTAVATSAAATLMLLPASNAADGTGVYAEWQVTGDQTAALGSFTGTVFPQIDVSAADGSLSVAKSATLTGTTPFGEVFGTSRGQQYLTSAIASGKPQGTATLNFEFAPVGGTWGFVVGDVDAEDITVSATDTSGNAIDVREWQYVPFNYASGETDQPTWNAETQTIVGNTLDTSGASMWVTPTDDNIATITLTQIRQSGFPQYQLWVAADVLTEADVATPDAVDEVCTVTDTELVNGGFELPVIPAKSFRQPNQRDVPGWDTTASDGKIELWSTGFGGVTAPEGNQFAELNATQPSELFQVVDTAPGETLTWSLLHRARAAGAIGDTMSVNIGPEGAQPNATYTFTDTLDEGWVRHTGTYTVPDGQARTRFGFESGPTASGKPAIGNFLDDIYFTTTECIPVDKTGGNTVEPESSPSATPSASESPSASASPSASVSPSASESPSPSPSAAVTAESTSPSPTASPSASTTPSPSASPTVSPSASSSASPTATTDSTPSASPSVSPSASPSPTLTKKPSPDPIPAKPDRTVVIDPVTDGGAPEGSTVTDVEPNPDGDVDIDKGDIRFTPKPGFIGTTDLTFTITTPEGEDQLTEVSVAVGKEQSVITRGWKPAKKLRPGLNHWGPGTFITNAGQVADVDVQCLRVLRNNSGKPDPKCSVIVGKNGTYISVKVYEPTAVLVTMKAPKKGKYLPLDDEFAYRVDK